MDAHARVLCSKIAVLIMNLLISITGMSLIALGLWMSLDEEGLRSVAQAIRSRELIDHLQFAAWALVGVGGVIFTIAFLGCAGAGCENLCMLYTFFIVILALFLTQMTALVLMIVYGEHMTDILTDAFERMEIVRPDDFDRIKTMEHCWHPRHCADVMMTKMDEQKFALLAAGAIMLTVELITMVCTSLLIHGLRTFEELMQAECDTV